ncbi:pyrroline-5-carboxylate reductase [Acetobacter aceti NBRC 14818]|uniref:Pyrroline-5-carboxylate reductase n=1 Tax=Acetobacter aceti NBRC 14818 TaxID=887700 RepID=A0AB33IJK5_ACEAC|nr:pyrroline-5-carboxylate reductase [Acetobacter aceti]TCS34579.1 pyrroline-5-carboxylate reductase [Acetobacter aceti NBRC 14818]BCK77004.1 pyrroline-5-carboxylate reductase [Acetobacter aceti NBRC 14818]GAN56445.1 pyrroline-5-carboxylate reductase [Acetobacter aceti NBRC 14818]
MTEPLPPLLLVGCGQMGGALLEAWIGKGLAPSVIMDRHRDAVSGPHTVVRELSKIPEDFMPEAVILAVKPQKAIPVMEELATLRPDIAERAVFVSVMAGLTAGSIAECLRNKAPEATPTIVRAMPNTPCSIGHGMTGLYRAPGVTDRQEKLCDRLLSAVGATVWVSEEDQINAVTAISGSGPAYVFLLAELLEKAAVGLGLPADVARILARKTVSGAGALLDHSPEDAAELRRRVTSPGGTTAAALAVLNAPANWPSAIPEAVAAAARRARELAS